MFPTATPKEPEFFDFAVPYIYRPLSSTELQIDDIIRWQRGERW